MKTSSNKAFDVISLGSCQVDFVGQQIGSSLKDMLSFEKYVGGISSLVATGCAHLGLRTAMISKVGSDAMGRFIVDSLQRERIDLSQVKSIPNSKSSLIFKSLPSHESQQTDLASDLILHENDICPLFIGKGLILFIHTHLFENEHSNRATRKAIIAATENQTKIILALDNSQDLANTNVLETVFPLCDVIIGYENNFKQFTGKTTTQQALEHLRSVTNALLCLVLEKGCFAYPKHIDAHWQHAPGHPGFDTDNTFAIAGLEAFIAGFIHATKHNLSIEETCQRASACQALAQTRKGMGADCPSQQEVEFYLHDQSQVVSKMHSPFFSHLHHGSTRQYTQNELCLFNFGYHAQWTKMAEPFAANESVISHLKDLIAQGVNTQAKNGYPVSLMVDDHILQKTLDLFTSEIGLVVRSVEMPNQVPLKFSLDNDITNTLSKWPKHHVAKISLIYHPDDRFALRQEQENTLALLYRACRATQHELMIDIAPPTNSLITASTIGHVIQRLYDVGIYPDWWQISSPRDARSWDTIQRTIDENDAYCKGVIVQAPLATFEQLAVLFEAGAKQKCCKGFAFGRAIYHSHLEQWFSQKIADTVLIDHIANNMQKVMTLWEQSKKASSSVSQLEKIV